MGKKVLITDDAVFMRAVLKNILTEAGYEVVGEASNGAEAFEKYKELNPDLVTMDIVMPEVDGIQGVKKIMDFDPDAKVIMVSSMGQEAMVKSALVAGAKEFIVKPFQGPKVIEAASNVLGG